LDGVTLKIDTQQTSSSSSLSSSVERSKQEKWLSPTERAAVSAISPWDNRGKCHSDERGFNALLVKRIAACTHFSSLFSSNSTRKFKSSPF